MFEHSSIEERSIEHIHIITMKRVVLTALWMLVVLIAHAMVLSSTGTTDPDSLVKEMLHLNGCLQDLASNSLFKEHEKRKARKEKLRHLMQQMVLIEKQNKQAGLALKELKEKSENA